MSIWHELLGDITKMRYSREPKYRKYVKGYGFLLFARKYGDKYGKILMDTATKTAASKRVYQKAAEALEIWLEIK